jgi:thymidylate kinase
VLKILKNVFERLNEENIDYIIYKGLSHLDEDLNAKRGADGDIDILISKDSLNQFYKIVKSFTIFRGIRHTQNNSCIVFDEDTKKIIFLDIDIKIKSGDRPYKPYFFEISFNKLSVKLINRLKLLDFKDYIPLMFLMRVTSPSPTERNLEELQKLLNHYDCIKNSYLEIMVEDFAQDNWNNIKKNIIKANNWQELEQRYKEEVLNSFHINYKLFYKQKMQKSIYLLERAKNRIFKTPPFKIRKKGHLVAFIGVDGAGKSSTVDYILGLEYFKYTGIKRIYFGNNEYWIPGVVWGLNNTKNRWVKIFFALLAHADRSLRSLYAYYYVKRGFIVVVDRFYYDDFVGQEMSKKNIKPTKSILKKIYRYIFKPRVWIQPDLTIFLDVSPEVAYSRKQDYSYTMMLEVNKAYKSYMPTVENVVIVNADNNQEIIYNEVVSHLLKLGNI